MTNRLIKVLAPLAGLAVFTVPGAFMSGVVVPANAECAGGICEVCPAVAQVLTATGAQIYCIA